MRYNKKLKKRDDDKPVLFDTTDILLLLEKAVMAEVVVSFHHQSYRIGVACEYDKQRRVFGKQTFYIDEQAFASLDDFMTHAVMDGQLFSDIKERLSVVDTQEGDPKAYLDLIAKIREDVDRNGNESPD